MMRFRLEHMVLVAVTLLAIASPALAVPVYPPTTSGVYGSFNNWTRLYRDGVGTVTSGTPQAGDEWQSLFEASLLRPNSVPLNLSPNGGPFWPKGAEEELTGLTYSFFVPGKGEPSGKLWEWQGSGYVDMGNSGHISSTSTTYYISNGGRFDVWLDTSPDFWDPATGASISVPDQGPDAWVDNAGSTPDEYPGATALANDGTSTDPDVTLYLSGTFAPLFSDSDLDYYRDAGEAVLAYWDPSGDNVEVGGVMTDPSGDDIAAVMISKNLEVGEIGGESYGWIDIDSGEILNSGLLWEDHLDLSGSGLDYDAFMLSTVNTPAEGWPSSSFDPIIFAVVPEPATMTLLLGGVAALGGLAAWRKRRN